MFLQAFLQLHKKAGTQTVTLILLWRQLIKKEGEKRGKARSRRLFIPRMYYLHNFNILCLKGLKGHLWKLIIYGGEAFTFLGNRVVDTTKSAMS